MPRIDMLPSPENVSIVESVPGSSAPKVLGQAEVRLSDGPDYARLLANAEKLSRGKFVEILKQSGLKGKVVLPKADRDVPEAIERLLSEMTFTSQFYAIRRLHELILPPRRIGSPAWRPRPRLCKPGVADRVLLPPRHKVFKARALYAQRMSSRDEHPAWAHWHKAYAWAAAGRPVDAMAELAAAEPDKTPPPKEASPNRHGSSCWMPTAASITRN